MNGTYVDCSLIDLDAGGVGNSSESMGSNHWPYEHRSSYSSEISVQSFVCRSGYRAYRLFSLVQLVVRPPQYLSRPNIEDVEGT
jgi:hypothetical protein